MLWCLFDFMHSTGLTLLFHLLSDFCETLDEEQIFLDRKREMRYDGKQIQESTTFWQNTTKSPQKSASELLLTRQNWGRAISFWYLHLRTTTLFTPLLPRSAPFSTSPYLYSS